MKYLNKSQKRLKLPSGAEIDIYKLNSFNEPFLQSSKKDEAQAGFGLSMFILTEKVGMLEFQGEAGKIVSKPAKDCAEFEIAVELLDQADADAIINGVLDFSGMTPAGQEARKTFPEKPANGGEPAPARQALRSIANGAVEAAA